jgi:hypothetical protein
VSVRRFRIWFEDHGHEVEFACAAWPTAAEREEALAGLRDLDPASYDPGAAAETRVRGRPSFGAVIADAVRTLGDELDRHPTLAARARAIQRAIAVLVDDPGAVPSSRTVEAYLAAHPVRKNSREKSRRKSRSAKMAITGG